MDNHKNILIAEVGGTKSDWRYISGGEVVQYQSTGFNPYFMPNERLQHMMNLDSLVSLQPDELYYYGAGCSAHEKIFLVEQYLKEIYPRTKIEVHSDMLAAARACCGHSPGITCILGTGSNACFFNGDTITIQSPSLGFWLGDEGSGGYLGKQLLIYYLQNRLPLHLSEAFVKRYPGSLSDWLQVLYSGDAPNAEAAKVSKFLFDHREDPFIAEMILKAFSDFLSIYVHPLVQQSTCDLIHFSGSVAFYFQAFLRKAVDQKRWKFGRVTEQPIAGLTLYHTTAI